LLNVDEIDHFLLITESFKYDTAFCSVRISYQIQPYVEHPWHVRLREDPVQLQGRVLRVNPEVQTTWKKFLFVYTFTSHHKSDPKIHSELL